MEYLAFLFLCALAASAVIVPWFILWHIAEMNTHVCRLLTLLEEQDDDDPDSPEEKDNIVMMAERKKSCGS